jgi:hypothetical protein
MSNPDPTSATSVSYHRHKLPRFLSPCSSRCGERGLWVGDNGSMDSRDRHRRRQTSSFAMGRESFFEDCFTVIINHELHISLYRCLMRAYHLCVTSLFAVTMSKCLELTGVRQRQHLTDLSAGQMMAVRRSCSRVGDRLASQPVQAQILNAPTNHASAFFYFLLCYGYLLDRVSVTSSYSQITTYNTQY